MKPSITQLKCAETLIQNAIVRIASLYRVEWFYDYYFFIVVVVATFFSRSFIS